MPSACHPGDWKTRGMEFVLIAIAIVVVALIAGVGLLVSRGRRTTRLDQDAASGTTLTRPRPPATEPPARPQAPLSPADQQQPDTVQPEGAPEIELPPAEPGLLVETPPPSAGRLV